MTRFLLAALLTAALTGCATVRSVTLPGTTREVYDLQAFTVRPPQDPSWRLASYSSLNSIVIFTHADSGASLAAWWVPAYPEEIRQSREETVVEFFREDVLSELKLSGDFQIEKTGRTDDFIDMSGNAGLETLYIEGLQGEKQTPFEAWLVYRSVGRELKPELHVFSYSQPVRGKTMDAPISEPPQAVLRELIQGSTPRPSDSPWSPWQRANGIYSRFLARHSKRTLAEHRPRVSALYQASKREAEEAARQDPERPELHDLLGLLACYNDNLEFLGSGFDAGSAERSFRKAISLRRNYSLAHYHLANMLTAQGRLDEAAAEFKDLAEISPTEAEYYYEQGKLHEKLGRPAEALASYRHALRFWLGATQTKKELEKKADALARAER